MLEMTDYGDIKQTVISSKGDEEDIGEQGDSFGFDYLLTEFPSSTTVQLQLRKW